MARGIYVIKASGEKEKFDRRKIEKTCLRAGASRAHAGEIADKVEQAAYDGITTQKILKTILGLLKSSHPHIAARYNLKGAIMNLGPSGYIFEKFFAEILERHGYSTEVNKIMRGKMISHEVDVVAKKDKSYMVECKYHNAPGIYTDLKVALYTYARFLDLQKYFDQPWLATNTRCSQDAIKYAEGVGMKVTSWHHPKNSSLKDFIEKEKLYPVTVLSAAKGFVMERLAKASLMFARDLLDNDTAKLKKMTGLPEATLKKLAEEAYKICFH